MITRFSMVTDGLTRSSPKQFQYPLIVVVASPGIIRTKFLTAGPNSEILESSHDATRTAVVSTDVTTAFDGTHHVGGTA